VLAAYEVATGANKYFKLDRITETHRWGISPLQGFT
jgi:hypothetical protein